MSGTTQVGRYRKGKTNLGFTEARDSEWYQKGKTNLGFTEARDSEWQWHQLDRMRVCTSLQTNNHTNTPTSQFFTGWMPFPTNSIKALLIMNYNEYNQHCILTVICETKLGNLCSHKLILLREVSLRGRTLL